MMSKIIFDTNVLVALIDKKDKFHNKAEEVYNELERIGWEIIIFDCVIDEALNVFSRRCWEQKREEEFKSILNKTLSFINDKNIIWVYDKVKNFYKEIINKLRETNGKLNFHDALIIISARYYEIKYIASFDSDFDKVEGLKRIKDKNDFGEEDD
jgi:predicted nucleic acid-binding protein